MTVKNQIEIFQKIYIYCWNFDCLLKRFDRKDMEKGVSIISEYLVRKSFFEQNVSQTKSFFC